MDDNIKEQTVEEMISNLTGFELTAIPKLEQSILELQTLGEDIKSMADKFKKYKQSLAKAQIKYRENNRDLINKIARDYYDRHKSNPEWRQKQSEKSKRAYTKKRDKEYIEKTLFSIKL